MDNKEKFGNLPLEKLVRIIMDTANYEDDAIIAAKAELESRNISPESLSRIKSHFENQETTESKNSERFDKVRVWLNNTFKNSRDLIAVRKEKGAKDLLNGIGFLLLLIGIYFSIVFNAILFVKSTCYRLFQI